MSPSQGPMPSSKERGTGEQGTKLESPSRTLHLAVLLWILPKGTGASSPTYVTYTSCLSSSGRKELDICTDMRSTDCCPSGPKEWSSVYSTCCNKRTSSIKTYNTCTNLRQTTYCTLKHSSNCCYGDCCDKTQYSNFNFRTCRHTRGGFLDICRDITSTFCCSLNKWRATCCDQASYLKMDSNRRMICTGSSDGLLIRNRCADRRSRVNYCCYETCCNRREYMSYFSFPRCGRTIKCRDYRSPSCCTSTIVGYRHSYCCAPMQSPPVPPSNYSEDDTHLGTGLYAGIAGAVIVIVGCVVLSVIWYGYRSSQRLPRSRVGGQSPSRRSQHPAGSNPSNMSRRTGRNSYNPLTPGHTPSPSQHTIDYADPPPAYDACLDNTTGAVQQALSRTNVLVAPPSYCQGASLNEQPPSYNTAMEMEQATTISELMNPGSSGSGTPPT